MDATLSCEAQREVCCPDGLERLQLFGRDFVFRGLFPRARLTSEADPSSGPCDGLGRGW